MNRLNKICITLAFIAGLFSCKPKAYTDLQDAASDGAAGTVRIAFDVPASTIEGPNSYIESVTPDKIKCNGKEHSKCFNMFARGEKHLFRVPVRIQANLGGKSMSMQYAGRYRCNRYSEKSKGYLTPMIVKREATGDFVEISVTPTSPEVSTYNCGVLYVPAT